MANARIITLPQPISLAVPGLGTITVDQVFPAGFAAIIDVKNPLGPQRLVVVLAAFNEAAQSPLYNPLTGDLVSMTVDVPDLDVFSDLYSNAKTAFESVHQLIQPAFAVWPIEQAIASALQTVPGLQAAVEKATTEAQSAIAAATAAKEQSIAQVAAETGQAVATANANKASMQAQLDDWNRGIVAARALPDGPDKTAAIAERTAKVAEFTTKLTEATAAVLAAQNAGLAAIDAATAAGDQAIGVATDEGNAAIAEANAPLASALSTIWQTYLGQWRTVAPALGVTDADALPLALQGQTKPDGF